MTTRFFNWEGRPAVFVGSKALAMLRGDTGWTEVSAAEVIDSGREMTEAAFVAMFPRLPRDAMSDKRESAGSAVRALAMSRALQRVGEKYDDPNLTLHGAMLEREATESVKAGEGDLERWRQRKRARARNLPRA